MKNFESFKKHLNKFEAMRKEMQISHDSCKKRETYAEAIGNCFLPCAQALLAGHFHVVNRIGGSTNERDIYPTALELYYHEEGTGRFKDPIMYHTTDRKYYDFYNDKYEKTKEQLTGMNYFERRESVIKELPYFPLGAFNPHTSGIDITFENPIEKYRASCLIRKYKISFNGGEAISIDNSTDIYDDMLLNGILLDNNECWIEWVDGDEEVKDIKRDWRKNVPQYRIIPAEKVKCTKYVLWEKVKTTTPVKGETFTINHVHYVRCPFNWQFSISNNS